MDHKTKFKIKVWAASTLTFVSFLVWFFYLNSESLIVPAALITALFGTFYVGPWKEEYIEYWNWSGGTIYVDGILWVLPKAIIAATGAVLSFLVGLNEPSTWTVLFMVAISLYMIFIPPNHEKYGL